MASDEQPARHTFPSWRATTAAWDVRPPCAVRIPVATDTPARSSVVRSVLNEITDLLPGDAPRAATAINCDDPGGQHQCPAGIADAMGRLTAHPRPAACPARARRDRVLEAAERYPGIDAAATDEVDGDLQGSLRGACPCGLGGSAVLRLPP